MNDIISHLKDETVKKNLLMRKKIKKAAEKFLCENEFDEFDTPVLTPLPGEIYNPFFSLDIDGQAAALADSPQLYKMMLVLSGCDRYYQFAHCFRPIAHEKNRETRLCEFMQIDTEMKVCSLNELTDFAQQMTENILTSLGIDFTVKYIDGLKCRNLYGPEMKPDLRSRPDEAAVTFITHMPLSNGDKTPVGSLVPCHHIFAQPSADLKNASEKDLCKMTTESFDIVINGTEIGGGDLRISNCALLKNVMDLFHVEKSCYTRYLDVLQKNEGIKTGGFAVGIERMILALSGCGDIRKTLAFPDFYMRSVK